MRHRLRIGFVVLSVAVAIAVFERIWDAHANRGESQVAQLAEKMRTICVGRILIDKPTDAQVEFVRSNIDGFNITVLYETKAEFDKRLAGRMADLTAMDAVIKEGTNLEQLTELAGANGVAGKLMAYSRRVTEGTRARGLELERFRNEGVAIEAMLHFEDVSFHFAAEYYDPDQI